MPKVLNMIRWIREASKAESPDIKVSGSYFSKKLLQDFDLFYRLFLIINKREECEFSAIGYLRWLRDISIECNGVQWLKWYVPNENFISNFQDFIDGTSTKEVLKFFGVVKEEVKDYIDRTAFFTDSIYTDILYYKDVYDLMRGNIDKSFLLEEIRKFALILKERGVRLQDKLEWFIDSYLPDWEVDYDGNFFLKEFSWASDAFFYNVRIPYSLNSWKERLLHWFFLTMVGIKNLKDLENVEFDYPPFYDLEKEGKSFLDLFSINGNYKNGLQKNAFNPERTSINKKIKEILGEYSSTRYIICGGKEENKKEPYTLSRIPTRYFEEKRFFPLYEKDFIDSDDFGDLYDRYRFNLFKGERDFLKSDDRKKFEKGKDIILKYERINREFTHFCENRNLDKTSISSIRMFLDIYYQHCMKELKKAKKLDSKRGIDFLDQRYAYDIQIGIIQSQDIPIIHKLEGLFIEARLCGIEIGEIYEIFSQPGCINKPLRNDDISLIVKDASILPKLIIKEDGSLNIRDISGHIWSLSFNEAQNICYLYFLYKSLNGKRGVYVGENFDSTQSGNTDDLFKIFSSVYKIRHPEYADAMLKEKYKDFLDYINGINAEQRRGKDKSRHIIKNYLDKIKDYPAEDQWLVLNLISQSGPWDRAKSYEKLNPVEELVKGSKSYIYKIKKRLNKPNVEIEKKHTVEDDFYELLFESAYPDEAKKIGPENLSDYLNPKITKIYNELSETIKKIKEVRENKDNEISKTVVRWKTTCAEINSVLRKLLGRSLAEKFVIQAVKNGYRSINIDEELLDNAFLFPDSDSVQKLR